MVNIVVLLWLLFFRLIFNQTSNKWICSLGKITKILQVRPFDHYDKCPFLSPKGNYYYQLGMCPSRFFFNTCLHTQCCIVLNFNLEKDHILHRLCIDFILFYNYLGDFTYQCYDRAFLQPELINSFNLLYICYVPFSFFKLFIWISHPFFLINA